jgi:rod shape determining protein RodA
LDKSKVWRHFDFSLFGAVLLLTIFGIAMIHSTIAGNVDNANIDTRQAIFSGIGLVFIFIVAAIDYHYWSSFTRIMYVGTILLLFIIFVIGQASFGSARWLNAGIVNIQPSEIAKIVIILVLSEYFAHTWDHPHNLKWIFKSLLITLGVVIWIVLQPNLSTSIVIIVLWFALIWISKLPMKYVFTFALVAVVVGLSVFPFLEGYQQERIITFIAPDPNERYGNNYNVDQAIIAIGSGGLFGEGYGHGTQVQLRFLKVRWSDFIFSAISEEFGFVGAVAVFLLMIFVILRCLRAARLAPDKFGALIAYGFAILIFFQAAVIIGVNLQVVPVTGLPLPFISYGGSSYISLAIGIGLVESIVMRQNTLEG